MATDIIPQSFQNLHDWLENLIPKITTQGPGLGMTPAGVTDFTAALGKIQTAANDALAAQAALDTASGTLHQTLLDLLPDVRRTIKSIKSSKTYNEGIGADLQIVATSSTFDPENYKPAITAEAFPGHIRIKGKKVGADGFNVYMRLKGQTDFKLIASNRTRFPFDDDAALAQTGTPETREYRVMGVP